VAHTLGPLLRLTLHKQDASDVMLYFFSCTFNAINEISQFAASAVMMMMMMMMMMMICCDVQIVSVKL